MKKSKENRIGKINDMLLEMATGNFSSRLEHSKTSNNDDIESLVVPINKMVEKLQSYFLHHKFVNTNDTMKHIVEMSFVLNHSGIIQMINQKASTILATTYNNIVKKPFDTLLTETSKTKWLTTLKKLQKKDVHDTALALTFKTGLELPLPLLCYITTFTGDSKDQRQILVTIIRYSTVIEEMEKELKERVLEFKNRPKQNVKRSKKKNSTK